MKKLLFLLSIVTLIFAGCSDDDDPEQPGGFEGTTLNGDITSDTELDASVTYTLDGTLSVKNGATLTIPAGTTIRATPGFSSYLIVEQGGKLEANGTANNPITFTSAASSPAAGDWGGIIINGFAPIAGGGQGSTEIDASLPYGGDDASDDSGSLSYVVLAYTGAQSNESIEHNGLTLNAVGNGTTISNLYIYDGADDAVEFFGGTVNVTNLLAVNCDDDMFDVTQGWAGTLDNAYGIWEDGYVSTEGDPRGVEADGNLDGDFPDQAGQSNFIMRNITIKNASSYLMEDGIKIRRGATATISNAVIMGGTAKDLIDLNDGAGNANTATAISLTADRAAFSSHDINASGTYPGVVIEAGNTGANTGVFGWTEYDFNADMTAEISGDVTEDMTLNALYTYTLNGTMSVKEGATLTIPAGTVIEATPGFPSYLVIEQGAMINAQGTADAPILFTSNRETPEAGDWGGLIINGYAPIAGNVTGSTEIDTSLPYGGSDAEDNSGILSYVILAYTGAQSNENIEHNGLTLDAVGAGTTIENLYIYDGADDAVEFFGGTVNVTNLLAVNCDDDMFDVTQGWSGTLTNAYGIWEDGYLSTEGDPRGVEADGNLDGDFPNQTGQSNFTMTDITIRNNSDYVMEDGIKIRRGATATITNALIMGGVAKNIIDLTDGAGDANTATSISLTVDGTTVTDGNDEIKANETYSNVAIEAGNTGASSAAFDWTSYSF